MHEALTAQASALCIARGVRDREVSAIAVVDAALARIEADRELNALTAVCAERARDLARRVDQAIARGDDPGPLAGVPFVAKAQIAIEGLTTTAGSKLHVDDPPAAHDADAVARLHRAGAVCLGAANMDELGMGGTTENRHFGATRNPHDRTRTPGGSSGGSAAAVAAGLVPISLGSDALGSVRLPASLCGVYGLRPTRGAIPPHGLLPSPGSITTIGPLARSVDDLAACFGVAAGIVDKSTISADEAGRLCVGIAQGYFTRNASPEALDAVRRAAAAFPRATPVDFPEAGRARAAAALVNAAESARPQLERLRTRPDDFDPLTRDRFLAHALMPAAWYFRAQAFREWHRRQVQRLLDEHPLLLFPATPCVAPTIGTRTLVIDGVEQPTGPSLGLYTQPLAALDCPVLTVPIAREGLPIGVQLLAAPGREPLLFAAAEWLERRGVARSRVAA